MALSSTAREFGSGIAAGDPPLAQGLGPVPPPPRPPPAAARKRESSFGEDVHREVMEPLKREIHAEMERHAAAEDAAQARRDAAQARRDVDEDMKPQELAAEIRRDVMDSLSELSNEERVVHTRLGEFLPQLA